jgi:fumarate reductase subunit D
MTAKPHVKPGFIAAMLHRLSGIALAIFLPMHFVARGMHMALGLRVLAIEFFAVRERSALVVSACVGCSLTVGLLFLLNGS